MGRLAVQSQGKLFAARHSNRLKRAGSGSKGEVKFKSPRTYREVKAGARADVPARVVEVAKIHAAYPEAMAASELICQLKRVSEHVSA